MAQLAAVVLANERTVERYARVNDAQLAALNEFIELVDPIMDLPMFNPGVNHNETVAEAEAAVTAAKKQRQAFRDQALKILNNRAEAQARVRVARAKAAETKAKIKREEKVRAQRAKATAERSEEDRPRITSAWLSSLRT